ncbi:MAG: hypothetical protein OK455_06915 [Thaumarchaeota archaeon]|nr:hypothetical protein [Nitrososphaerota archaeon]
MPDQSRRGRGRGAAPAPRAPVDLHLRKLASWLVLLDLNIDMTFLQLGAMNKDDKEHYGLNRKSMRYKMRYLGSRGMVGTLPFSSVGLLLESAITRRLRRAGREN